MRRAVLVVLVAQGILLPGSETAAPGRGAGRAGALATASAPPRVSDVLLTPGQILHAARPTAVRTRGGGNLLVDLPRGRALRVVDVRGDTVILEPGPADASLLRQFGVRRIPRYAVSIGRVTDEFVAQDAWERLRAEELRRIHDRWPGLSADQADRLFEGDPWIGMSQEQAEAAVGVVVFSRETGQGPAGPEEIWRIGRRTRTAELVQFTERRERDIRAKTFDEYLVLRTRALLRFRGGVLVAIETPPFGR